MSVAKTREDENTKAAYKQLLKVRNGLTNGLIDKLDPDLKKEWVEALRSGKYVQGNIYLKKKNNAGTQHCCLGVLCEIKHPKHFSKGNGVTFEFADTGNGHAIVDSTLPEEFRRSVMHVDIHNLLWMLNDYLSWNFNQIADFIEKEL